ncbi:MAG: hypothetical protein JSW27_20760, partial [Phycisphaerales bacterium]
MVVFQREETPNDDDVPGPAGLPIDNPARIGYEAGDAPVCRSAAGIGQKQGVNAPPGIERVLRNHLTDC